MITSASQSLRRLVAACVLTAVAGASAGAQVLHDNGVPDNGSGYGVTTGSWLLDDFSLSTAASLGSFQWYAFVQEKPGPATVTASYGWQIFSDASGTPGTLVASGSVTDGTGAKTSYYCCANSLDMFTGYLFQAALGDLPLGAGTYWLAIGDYASASGFGYWATSSYGSGNARASWDGLQTTAPVNDFWSDGDAELAFSVLGSQTVTPEPSTLVLLSSGFLGIVGVARRKKT